MVRLINAEDARVAAAVAGQAESIAAAVDLVAARLAELLEEDMRAGTALLTPVFAE